MFAFDDGWRHPRPRTSTTSRTSAPIRRPWPVGTAAAVGMLFPGPYRVPAAAFTTTVAVLQHRPGARPTAGRGSSSRWRARSLLDIAARRIGLDPIELRRRNLLARRRAAVHQRQRDALLRTSRRPRPSSRRSRCSTTRPSAASRPSARADGRYLGVGTCNYVEPTTPGAWLLRHRGRDHPHRPVGHGERLRGRRLDRQQPRDDRGAAHRRRARRADRRRPHHPGRHRGDALRRGHRRQPQRLDDRGRRRGDGDGPAGADRRHRRPTARGSARRHRARRQPGAASAGTPDGGRHLGEDRRDRLLPAAQAARRASRPGSRPASGTRHRSRGHLGQRHRTCARARSTSRPVRSRCCATS